MSAASINVSVADLSQATKKKRLASSKRDIDTTSKKSVSTHVSRYTSIHGFEVLQRLVSRYFLMKECILFHFYLEYILRSYCHYIITLKVIGIVMSILSFHYHRYEKNLGMPINKEYTICTFWSVLRPLFSINVDISDFYVGLATGYNHGNDF